MKRKLKVVVGISVLIVTLMGCGDDTANQNKLNEESKQLESNAPAKEVKKSFAEKYPEVEPQLVETFNLDKEYSKDVSDFFSMTEGSKEIGETIILYSSRSDQDYADFYAMGYDDKGETQKRKVIRVGAEQKYVIDEETNDHFKVEHARIRYKVIRNESGELNSINEDKEKWKATEYDVANDSHDYFREFASGFDKVLVYTERKVGQKIFILYKYIHLSGGYKLELRVTSDKYSIRENLSEINKRLDSITVNPVLLH